MFSSATTEGRKRWEADLGLSGNWLLKQRRWSGVVVEQKEQHLTCEN